MSVENAVKEIKEQVSGMNGRLDTAGGKLSMINEENKMLRNRVNELESYQIRWNLKISGNLEQDDKNVKMTVIDLLSCILWILCKTWMLLTVWVPDRKMVLLPHNHAITLCNS